MDACTFESFLSQMTQLSSHQCARVLVLLTPRADQTRTVDILQGAVADKMCCPRCQGTSLYRHGEANGLQRFRCRACGRTFNCLTGTPLARLRLKDKWLAYADCLLDSRAVRKAAAKVGVSKIPACAGTIVFWRSPRTTVRPA